MRNPASPRATRRRCNDWGLLNQRTQLRITGNSRFAIRHLYVDRSEVESFRDGNGNEAQHAACRLDMPLTPSVASAPSVASRHVGNRITLYEPTPARMNEGKGAIKIGQLRIRWDYTLDVVTKVA
jgi:hypothetical protein